MSLYNAYYILEGDHNLSIHSTSKDNYGGINNYQSIDIKNDGFGKYYWSKNGLSLYNYNFEFYILDSRRIICFTSTIINVLDFSEYLKNKYNWDMNVVKINMDNVFQIKDKKLHNVRIDPIVGVSFIIIESTNLWPLLVNIYRTGLTTFNMSNKNLVSTIVKYNLKFIEASEDKH